MRLLVQKGDRSSTEVLNVRMIEKINTVLVWIGLVGLVAAAITRSWVWALGGVAIFLWVVLSNLAMFRFFWRRGWRLALAALPLHLLYYFLNGISAGTGILLHHLIGEPQPPPTVQAYAEVGVETGPPVPTRVKSSPWSQPAAGHDSADGGTA
jgi:hypothetical protein